MFTRRSRLVAGVPHGLFNRVSLEGSEIGAAQRLKMIHCTVVSINTLVSAWRTRANCTQTGKGTRV